MTHIPFIVFFFLVGSCVGSFLNVVIWRLPRGESLSTPSSHCPKCGKTLKWYDNIPIFGWLKLAGRCRFCGEKISVQYPIIELITALLFVFYYVMFYIVGVCPCPPAMPAIMIGDQVPWRTAPLDFSSTWPMYLLYMFMVCGLLAASVVDFEQFIIPIQIPWVIAVAGIIVHAVVDTPHLPGALNCNPSVGALAAGGAIGVAISALLLHFKILPLSFPNGEPIFEADRPQLEKEIAEARQRGEEVFDLPPPYTSRQIRAHMRPEMLFLMPPMLLAAGAWAATTYNPALHDAWESVMRYNWLSGLLGSIFGALMGGFVIWITRILFTAAMGKLGMGLGDVHLMIGIGAVIGAGAAVVTFFLAPLLGILIALARWLIWRRREIQYGPYLSLAAALLILIYCPIAAILTPGLLGLRFVIHETFKI